jgi:hypothetical protein
MKRDARHDVGIGPGRRGRVGRRLPRPLLASLAIHGAAALLLALTPHRRPTPAHAPADVLEIELRNEAPGPETAAAPAGLAVAPPTTTSGPAARGSGARARTERPVAAAATAVSPTVTPVEPGPSLLSMRRPGDSLLPATAPHGLDPSWVPPRSGSVLPGEAPPDVIHHAVADPLIGRHAAGSGVTAKVANDGAITFTGPDVVEDVKVEVLPGHGILPGGLFVTGKPDFNDQVLRAMGEDPYAYAKKKYREASFEDRVCLAEKAALGRKQEGLFRLKERLEQLQRQPGLSQAQRRELVFEMWDECGEVPDSDKAEPDLGAAARATILAFIRRAFPADGPQAFATSELAALNRRRSSRLPFDPYGSVSSRVP